MSELEPVGQNRMVHTMTLLIEKRGSRNAGLQHFIWDSKKARAPRLLQEFGGEKMSSLESTRTADLRVSSS